jgi:hypothetical protein
VLFQDSVADPGDFWPDPDPVPDSVINKFLGKFLLEIFLAEICPKKNFHEPNS